MFASLQLNTLYVLVTYGVLSLTPFLALAVGRPITHWVQILGAEFIAWLAVWGIFKRPAWFHWLLLPAFLFLPIELYLQLYYGQGISTHHLGIIAETSPGEAMEFLGNKLWLLLIVFASALAWFLSSWKAARRTTALDWDDYSRWVTLGLLGLGLCFWLYGREFGVHAATASAPVAASITATSNEDEAEDDADTEEAVPQEEEAPATRAAVTTVSLARSAGKASSAGSASSSSSLAFPKLPSWAQVPFDLQSFGATWPFGLVMHAYDFWKERSYLSELAGKSKAFQFGAQQLKEHNQPQIVVMVIGESSRYDRWSLNGYRRETNPLLKNEPNLVSLSNVITAVSATRLSVPVLVSRKPATQSLKAGFSEKSFLSAFKEAGFKTFWLSNQMSFGQFDTPISVFANEADVTQFLNLGGFTDQSSLDAVLLEPLKHAIADKATKKLIVLHTLGNHWNYSHRYPKEYDKWQPSLFGVDNPAYTDLKLKDQLSNSYDNSILYTDWFLHQVIGTLKDSGDLSSMMYIADHGQLLYDGSCKLAFHGHNTQYEFHVPALVWYSDLYRDTYPDKIKQLLKRKRAKLSTENIFHSLLDMADIRYSTEQLDRSFLSKKFKQHKRYVDSHGWTDYDNATFKGDCREVIAKGKPLPQEK